MLARDADAHVEFVRTGTQVPDHRAQFDRLGTGPENEHDLLRVRIHINRLAPPLASGTLGYRPS